MSIIKYITILKYYSPGPQVPSCSPGLLNISNLCTCTKLKYCSPGPAVPSCSPGPLNISKLNAPVNLTKIFFPQIECNQQLYIFWPNIFTLRKDAYCIYMLWLYIKPIISIKGISWNIFIIIITNRNNICQYNLDNILYLSN